MPLVEPLRLHPVVLAEGSDLGGRIRLAIVPLSGLPGAEEPADRGGKLVGRGRLADEEVAARFLDPGEVEDVVDEREEVEGARLHHSELLRLVLIEGTAEALQKDAREADDRVERRPELVGHRREKGGLELVRCLGPVPLDCEFGGPRRDQPLEALSVSRELGLRLLPRRDVAVDTVNLASRMESYGVPGAIQVTRAVYEKLSGRYPFEPRGFVAVKGKGPVEAWTLGGS